jgi:sensor histidine kinase YesM
MMAGIPILKGNFVIISDILVMGKEGKLNDRAIKILGVPLFGIFIPNIAGLITTEHYSIPGLVACYAFFILFSYALWQGNVMMLYYVRNLFKWSDIKYYTFIGVLLGLNLLYSIFVSLAFLLGWKMISREHGIGWPLILHSTLIMMMASMFITSLYENIFLNQERIYNISRVEQLNIAKAQAELEALKNQIDPHFIFNSLNTLSYLITRDPMSARLYNDTLARVYRYILSNREKDLVLLKEEIEFISNYFYLIKIRFREAVHMMIEIEDLSAEDFLIPPISMQALVENAIKHNDFTDKTPLEINVYITSNFVVVRNLVNPKSYAPPSSGIGLVNLDNRYKMITKRNIVVENNPRNFSVKLPILKF